MAVQLARFGHCPDPVQDFLIEAEVIQGEVYNTIHDGPHCIDAETLHRRIEVALSTNWLDQDARNAGRLIAAEGKKLLAHMQAKPVDENAASLQTLHPVFAGIFAPLLNAGEK